MTGVMHGRGVCGRGMCGGGHAWQGVCVVGVCMVGGVHTPPNTTRYSRSMRGRYASYWNAFLLFVHFQFSTNDSIKPSKLSFTQSTVEISHFMNEPRSVTGEFSLGTETLLSQRG